MLLSVTSVPNSSFFTSAAASAAAAALDCSDVVTANVLAFSDPNEPAASLQAVVVVVVVDLIVFVVVAADVVVVAGLVVVVVVVPRRPRLLRPAVCVFSMAPAYVSPVGASLPLSETVRLKFVVNFNCSQVTLMYCRHKRPRH